MSNLRVIDKGDIPQKRRKSVEVHWQTPGGKHEVDVYPGECLIEKDVAGMTSITYLQEDENGGSFEVVVTYGYGEDRKVIEVYEQI